MKLLNKREVTGLPSSMNLVKTKSDTRDIEKIATTGDSTGDIIVAHAIKTSQEMENTKRLNELAEMKIKSNGMVQSYEAEWAGKDKFSDENYKLYEEGLNKIYSDIDSLTKGKKFINDEDAAGWQLSTKANKESNFYANLGQKNQYDIKSTVDSTMINKEGLIQDYINNPNEKEAEKSRLEAVKLMDSLSGIIPKTEIENMKIETLVKASAQKVQAQANSIINDPKKSLQQKREMLQSLQKGLTDKSVFSGEAGKVVKNGEISKEFESAYANILESEMKNFSTKSDGLISQLNQQIETQQFRAEQKKLSQERRITKQYIDERMKLYDYTRNGNNLNAVNLASKTAYTQDELLEDPKLMRDYFGKDSAQIIDENGFVGTLGIYKTNDMKNKSRIRKESGINRVEVLEELYSESGEKGTLLNEDIRREMLSAGVVDTFEDSLKNGDFLSVPQRNDFILDRERGREQENFNKVRFSEISEKYSGGLTKKVAELDSDYQKRVLTEIMLGKVLKGQYGAVADLKTGFNSTSIRQLYTGNEDFKRDFDNTTEMLKNVKPKKYKRAQVDFKKLDSQLRKNTVNEYRGEIPVADSENYLDF